MTDPAQERPGWTAARYARAIESRWSRLQDDPVVLSPREWRLIDRWYGQGVPLQLIEEAMADTLERERGRHRRSRLVEVARAVEQAWSALREGRVAGDPAEEEPPQTDPEERWRARLAGEAARSPLGLLLRELLERRSAGEAGGSLDERLDRCLVGAVDARLARRVEAEVQRELAPHRGRMSEECFAATRRSAVVERLRRQLDLPRLSGRDRRG